MARRRISIQREDRIWSLRTQGYDYDSIARIVNVDPASVGHVIRRVMRRPPLHVDPIRRGRGHSFLSDLQVQEIRLRRQRGETLLSVGRRFNLSESAVCCIALGRTYAEPEESGYPYEFGNRLVA